VPDIIHVTDQDSRANIEATLKVLTFAAKRVTPVVGSEMFPTPWDRAHGRIDAVLDEWLAAR